VDTFLLSCRVLGRGVEHRVLARLGEDARARGVQSVVVPFVPTAKNRPALDFLQRVAGEFEEEEREAGRQVFVLPAETCAEVRYRPDEGMAETGADAPDARRASAPRADSEVVQRVATELRDVDRIFAAIQASRVNGDSAGGSELHADASDLERSIAAIWREVLGRERIGLQDRFAEVGGTSLRAVQLVARLKRECGIAMSLVDLYEHPTVAALAEHFGNPESGAAARDQAQAVRERGERRRERRKGRRRKG